MNSELTIEFVRLFGKLPSRTQKTARKNYRLWKQNPTHSSLEFKKLKTNLSLYSVRVGIGWRAIGVMKNSDNNCLVLDWITHRI
jgi:hypothetical protein